MSVKEEGGWSRKQTLCLISELKKYELIYKVTHPDHLKIYKKQEALQEIAATIKNVRPNVTPEEVKKKIKVLQQQVAQEKKKMRTANRSGMSTDDVYMSKLWCFNELKFLLEANDEIRGHSNLEIDTLDDSFCQSTTSSSSKKSKRSRLDEVNALRGSANKSMELVSSLIAKRASTEETKASIFCKMLCSELQDLKLEETYERVTTNMLLMVRKEKANERKKLSWRGHGHSQHSSSSTLSSFSESDHSAYSSVESLNNFDHSITDAADFIDYSPDESFGNATLVEEPEDFEPAKENNVQIQSVEIFKHNDILQQAFDSILDD